MTVTAKKLSIRFEAVGGDKVRQEFKNLGTDGERAFKQITQVITPANDNLKALNTRAKIFNNVLKQTATLAGAYLGLQGLSSAFKGLIATNNEFESLSGSLKTVTGSAENASAAFALIEKFALDTPYQLDEIVEAFIRLKALGIEPSVEAIPMPEITLTLDNVSTEIMQYLDEDIETQNMIEMTYRPYLSSDLSIPQMDPPITLMITEVTADISKITVTARMTDIGNKTFPSENYNSFNIGGSMNNFAIKGIYLITRKIESDDGEPIYYIGQAKNIFERFNDHCHNGGQPGIDAAISRYGVTSFFFEILDVVKKQPDRDTREKEIIKEYIQRYGEKKIYNRQSGGRKGQETINKTRQKLDNNLRQKIRNIFEQDIGYSVDLIAEHFCIDGLMVIRVRKPLLRRKGLKYNKSIKHVVYIETGKKPDNWRGGILTKNQVKIYEANKAKELDEICSLMHISITDLRIFKKEYDGHEKEYKTAEECCDLGLLE